VIESGQARHRLGILQALQAVGELIRLQRLLRGDHFLRDRAADLRTLRGIGPVGGMNAQHRAGYAENQSRTQSPRRETVTRMHH
jgi:hypothetical protein